MNNKTRNYNITELDKIIAINVRNLRKKFNLSGEDLAEHLNVEGGFIRNIETFKSKYNVRHLYLIRDLFLKHDKNFTFEAIFSKNNDEIVKELKSLKRIKNKIVKEVLE